MNRKQIEAIKSTIHYLELLEEHADLTSELREAFPKLAAELDHENQTHDIIVNAATEAGLRRGPKVVEPAEGEGFAVLAEYYARPVKPK